MSTIDLGMVVNPGAVPSVNERQGWTNTYAPPAPRRASRHRAPPRQGDGGHRRGDGERAADGGAAAGVSCAAGGGRGDGAGGCAGDAIIEIMKLYCEMLSFDMTILQEHIRKKVLEVEEGRSLVLDSFFLSIKQAFEWMKYIQRHRDVLQVHASYTDGLIQNRLACRETALSILAIELIRASTDLCPVFPTGIRPYNAVAIQEATGMPRKCSLFHF